MTFFPSHLETGFRQLYEWLVGQYDPHSLETEPDSYSEKVSPTLFSGSYSLGLLALFVSRAQASEPNTIVIDPDKDLKSEDGMHFFGDVAKIRNPHSHKIEEAVAQNSDSYITVDLLPGVHISHLREIKDEEGRNAWLFNVVKTVDQKTVLENYVLMPYTQHATKSLDDHDGFDARLNQDGTLTFSIKNARQKTDGTPFPLVCQFKNNGLLVNVDASDGKILKVLSGVLDQPAQIGKHHVPAGYQIFNLPFDQNGRPKPDQSSFARSISDGRLPVIPLYP